MRKSFVQNLSCALIALLALTVGAMPAQASDLDLQNLTVTQIQSMFSDGTLTSVELTEAYFEQIDTYNGIYNAWITLDRDGALAQAAAADALRAGGGEFGPLFGIPIAIKDPMDVAGLPTTAGSKAFSSTTGGIDIIPDTDSPLVARFRAAGAIIMGKTNVPDFSRSGTNSTSSLMGATLNAYDITRVPGGSSGGSGVALATGMSTIAMAEETGSSITNPASASSLVGVRPTFGLIPSAGVFPLRGTFRDVVGPLARTVEDAAIMMDTLAGPTPLDPKTLDSGDKIPVGGYAANLSLGALNGARIAVYGPGWNDVDLAPETQTLFQQELTVLESLGATLIDDPFLGTDFEFLEENNVGENTFGFDVERYLERLGPGAAFNSTAEYEALTGENFFDIERMPGPGSVTDPTAREDLDEFYEWRTQIRAAFEQVMEDLDLDAVVMPQLAEPVPTLESGDGISRTPGSAVNLMGIPGVVVPGGYFSDGTPFATYFVGQRWDEMDLLNLAYDYEQATLHRVAPVLVPEPTSLIFVVGAASVMLIRRRRQAA